MFVTLPKGRDLILGLQTKGKLPTQAPWKQSHLKKLIKGIEQKLKKSRDQRL